MEASGINHAQVKLPTRGDAGMLFDAAAARRRAERDAILLANRIRLLKEEELRMKKKISDTESRTREILFVRQRNVERRRARQNETSRRDAEAQEARERQFFRREDHARRLEQRQQGILGHRRALSNEVRQEREAIQQRRQEQRVASLETARKAHERVCAGHTALAAQRVRAEEAKRESVLGSLRSRHETEVAVCKAKEELIRKMEREEAMLIQRLQLSQDRYRDIFEKLEVALKDGGSTHATSSTLALSLGAARGATPNSRPRTSSCPRLPRRSGEQTAPCRRQGQVCREASLCNSVGDASTASGPSSVPSGDSTPSSGKLPVSYTTVDGAQIIIPLDEELDLEALLAF
jgi:hypothetical protein